MPFPLPQDKSLSDPWARLAWVVPIRGGPAWPHATPAAVLSATSSSQTPATTSPDRITWTHASLVAFWGFLLDLRKTGEFGSISLSFQPVTARTELREDSASSATPKLPVGLQRFDHFKVYHDARITMYIRRALELWEFGKTRAQKRHQLSNACLALIDSRSECILVA